MSESLTVEDVSGLEKQNGAALGRFVGRGPLRHVTEDEAGRMHAELRILPDEMIWDPTILVMPHGGDLDLDIYNDDLNTHCVMLPSNEDRQFLWLPIRSHGTATLILDGPGTYFFSSPIGNDEGRGLVGAIVVTGEVPDEARLDRPAQPRP